MTNKKKGKWSIWKAIRNMFIFLDAAVVILSAGYIVARLYDYYASARAYRTIEEMYVKHPLETEDKEPSVTESPAVPKEDREIPVAMEPQGNAVPERMKVDWEGLRAANPDVVAWLYVPMTGISYPVVQGGINDEYLHKSFTGEYRYAGAIFLGQNTPEPLGDYMAGPCHVLPTSGTARFFSPLSVESFLKKTSVIDFSREALEMVADDIIRMAESESLTAHANSIQVRF